MCCVGSDLCDELFLVQRSPSLCICLIVCDVETRTIRRLRPQLGTCATGGENIGPTLSTNSLSEQTRWPLTLQKKVKEVADCRKDFHAF